MSGLDWVAHYEFVTIAQDGVGVPPVSPVSPVSGDQVDRHLDCDRVYHSDMAGGGYITTQEYAVNTPRNIFLYGRGGQENVTCR